MKAQPINRFLLIILFMAGANTAARATNYYISSAGSDANDGLSECNPFKSLDPLNYIDFDPGDSVLFRGGDTLFGGIVLKMEDAGTAVSPVVFTSYQHGRATIETGQRGFISASDVGGITVFNLNLHSEKTQFALYHCFSFMAGPKSVPYVSNIVLMNLSIQNSGTGISFWHDYGKGDSSYFRDVLIENVKIIDVDELGFELESNLKFHKSHHRKFTLRNVEVLGGEGGFDIRGLDSSMIEGCRASGSFLDYDKLDGLESKGFFIYNTIHVTVQHCQSDHNNSYEAHGFGFYFGGSNLHTLIQYNYAHANSDAGFYIEGNPFAVQNPDDIIFRYNIAENNGGPALDINTFGSRRGPNNLQKIYAYNNTFYCGPSIYKRRLYSGIAFLLNDFDTLTAEVYNNIFYTVKETNFGLAGKSEGVLLHHNIYYTTGKFLVLDEWKGKITSIEGWRDTAGQEMFQGEETGEVVDPDLLNPGKGGTIDDSSLLYRLDVYRLKSSSPLLNMKFDLSKVRPNEDIAFDFYGNKLRGTWATPGACDTFHIRPHPSFTADKNTCLGQPVGYKNNSTGAASQVWHFGDGETDTAASTQHTYAKPGKYISRLVLTSATGYKDSAFQQINVYSPSAQFQIPPALCLGSALCVSASDLNSVAYKWSFGDSAFSNSRSASHLYINPGSYIVELVTMAGACADTVRKTIIIGANPLARWTYSADKLAVTFTADETGYVKYQWNWGDGQIETETDSASFSYVYSQPGTYKVTLTVTDSLGCADTSSLMITVTTTGISESEPVQFTFSPNPFISQASVSWQGAEASSAVLMDAQGRVVRRYTAADFGAGGRELQISGDGLLPGVYLLRVLGSTVLGSVMMVRE